MEALRPAAEKDVLDAVAWAVAGKRPLELVSGATKRGIGRPVGAEAVLDLSGLQGVLLYEPEELVLTARPGTRLSEIEALLAGNGQCLAFEPPDLGPLLGAAEGAATLGGALAANLSGPRRPKAGAARDHLLGVKAVSGRAERFKSGGRVVKNVTGYDLPKLLAGSWGTLAAVTEATVKVLPAPEKLRTVLVAGLDPPQAAAAMGRVLSGPLEASGCAHLPAPAASASAVARVRALGGAVTALRVEGPAPSAEARAAELRALFADAGPTEELHGHDSRVLWREIAGAAFFVDPPDRLVWRLSLPPAEGARAVAEIGGSLAIEAFYDWGGALVWLAVPGAAEADAVRRAAARCGGRATLVRAPEAVRRKVGAFHPRPAGRAALDARVKRAFDPEAVLNPGRMYDGS